MNRRTFLSSTAAATAGLALSSCRSMSLPASAPDLRPGRFVMINFNGLELDARTIERIQRYGIRGFCLFQSNIQSENQVRGLISSIRALAGPDALVAIDQEGGGVIRTRTLPFPPSAMSLGASGDEALARSVGAATARGLRSLGINWNFAPVLDVNSNPLNPVISDRSFGSDPALVARMARAWMQGSIDEQVAPCVKHFPGHGDTTVDSHYGLPVVEKGLAALEAEELAPFRALLMDGDAPCVMSAHIIFRALDAELPATLSRRILTDMLRREWGYEGLIVTDSLSMAAIAEHFGHRRSGVMSIQAGADMAMALGTHEQQDEALEALQEAFDSGVISRESLLRRQYRLDRFSERFPLQAPTAYGAALQTADADIMETGWARGLTTWRGAQPIAPGTAVTLVVPASAQAGAASDSGLTGTGLIQQFSNLYDLRVVVVQPNDIAKARRDLDAFHRPGTPLILATTGRRRPEGDLLGFYRDLQPALHIALWNPYTVLDISAPALITFGFRPEALRATESWLRGTLRATGTLPIALSAS